MATRDERGWDASEPGSLETDAVEVRALSTSDLDAVVAIDRESTGRTRREYFDQKLREASRDRAVHISLAAVVDGRVAGFVIGRLYYGEFGAPEPVAILDTIGVRGRHVARALLRQLRMNLCALGIERIETQVEWTQQKLIGFFAHEGFKPAPRLCLELAVERPRD